MHNPVIYEQLNACAAACNACYASCLNEDDVAMMARCIELNRDCAEVCLLAASLVARDSENADNMLALCANLCTACAEECEKHSQDHCKRCAQVCRACAELCQSPAH
ncbi:MAG: four-helix bundle copper-binding protein [Bacteroidota bacterium]